MQANVTAVQLRLARYVAAQRMNAAEKLGVVVLLALGLLLGLLVTLPATANATTETASLGPVSATLTYQVNSKPENGFVERELASTQLDITRGGQLAYSRPVASSLPYCVVQYPGECWPRAARAESREIAAEYPSLQVVELAPNGEPDVVLHLYSGGAHCCYIDQVFSWSAAAATYGVAERSWASLPPRLSDLTHNGHLEFVTGDHRFEYQFTSFAFSGFPLQIFAIQGGAFVDVTRSYRSQIATDARSQYRRYQHWRSRGFGLGFLAAWVADEYLLGQRRRGVGTLQRENRLGHLLEARVFMEAPVNRGGAFIGKLKRFLRKIGYG